MGVADDFPFRCRPSLAWTVAQMLLIIWVSQLGMQCLGMAAGVFPVPRRATAFGLGFALAASTVGGLVGAALAWRQLGFGVGPGGLAVGRPFRRPVVVTWDDMEAVRPKWGLLIPWLLVTVRAGKPVGVPLRLADPDGFAAAVREHAGPDHPLTLALAERLPAD